MRCRPSPSRVELPHGHARWRRWCRRRRGSECGRTAHRAPAARRLGLRPRGEPRAWPRRLPPGRGRRRRPRPVPGALEHRLLVLRRRPRALASAGDRQRRPMARSLRGTGRGARHGDRRDVPRTVTGGAAQRRHAVRRARARGAPVRQGAHLQLRPAGAGARAGGGVPGRPTGDGRRPRRRRVHDLLRPRVPRGRARACAGRGRADPRPQRLRARGQPARPDTVARLREHGRRGRDQLRGATGERPLDGGRPDRLRRGRSQPRHAPLRGRRGGGRLRRPPRPRGAARVAPARGVGEPLPAAGDLRCAGRRP